DGRETSGLLSKTLGLVGNVLKPGTPVIKITLTGGPYSDGDSKTASSLSTVILGVSSPALYTQVKVATVTDTSVTFNTTAYSGSYNTQSTDTVGGIKVTLADGSKLY